MQTYLPYPDFEESAYALGTKRLGKQRIMNFELMQALFGVKMVHQELRFTGEYQEKILGGDFETTVTEPVLRTEELPRERWSIESALTPRWVDHPVYSLWKGHEWQLLNYQRACCVDWMENHGFEDTYFEKTLWLYFMCHMGQNDYGSPSWLGDEDFHKSHKSELIRQDPSYYRKIFPDTTDSIPLIWPNKKV